MQSLLLLLVIAYCGSVTAITWNCGQMQPDMTTVNGANPQVIAMPFEIRTDKTVYSPGDVITGIHYFLLDLAGKVCDVLLNYFLPTLWNGCVKLYYFNRRYAPCPLATGYLQNC